MKLSFLEGLKTRGWNKVKERATDVVKMSRVQGLGIRDVHAGVLSGKRDAKNCWMSDGALTEGGQLLTRGPKMGFSRMISFRSSVLIL